MSLMTIAVPATLPAAQAFAGTALSVARPLLGLGALALLLVMFKPLLLGLLRAAVLMVKPRRSLEERRERHLMESIMMLNRMARDLDGSQPGLASELRSIAARS